MTFHTTVIVVLLLIAGALALCAMLLHRFIQVDKLIHSARCFMLAHDWPSPRDESYLGKTREFWEETNARGRWIRNTLAPYFGWGQVFAIWRWPVIDVHRIRGEYANAFKRFLRGEPQ